MSSALFEDSTEGFTFPKSEIKRFGLFYSTVSIWLIDTLKKYHSICDIFLTFRSLKIVRTSSRLFEVHSQNFEISFKISHVQLIDIEPINFIRFFQKA